MRNAWLSAALVAASLLALGTQFAVVGRTGFFVGDFRAFYCAASVTAHHENPYRTEPLRTCELNAGPKNFFRHYPGLTIPAPLPGYVLGALIPLTFLPFTAAALLWVLVLLAACIVAIVTLSRFANIPWQVALAAFSLSLGVLSVAFGEVVPISIACICLSAYCAWKGRWNGAALAAAGSFIEPHLGLPVALALVVFVPRTRVVIGVAVALLAAASLAALGVSTNIEYVTSVLPAHVLSEIYRDTQYSLTEFLVSLGAPLRFAIEAGTTWYVAMIAFGLFIARRLAEKTKNQAFLVCVPPTFAVFGGTFIHVTQIAVAIPAAILFAAYARGTARTLAAAAMLALCVPWGWIISLAMMLAPVFPVGYLAWMYWHERRATLIAALAAAVIAFSIVALPRGPLQGPRSHAAIIDTRFAEASWGDFTQRTARHDASAWIVRVPTWGGLLLLLLLFTRDAELGRNRRPLRLEYARPETS